MTDGIDEATPVDLAFLPGVRRYDVAFSGPTWSCAASYPSLSAPPSMTRVLSETGTLMESGTPRLFHAGDRLVCMHAGPRGVELVSMDPERPSSELAFPDAAVFAVAAGRRQSRLFAVDGRGLVSQAYAPKSRSGPTERWIEHPGRRAFLAAARAGEGEIALVSWEGERALYVAIAHETKPRVVRHELPDECVGLAAFGAGNRAGVALALAGGGRVDVAIVDAKGTMVERLHTCLEGRGAVWKHPDVLWVEDGFYLFAVDETAGRTVVARFEDGEIHADVVGASGPFTAAYYEKKLYVVRASLGASTDEVKIRGHRLTLTGADATRPFELSLAPPKALWRKRAEAHAARVINLTVSELDTARHGYRGEGKTGPSGASLVEGAPATLRIEPLHRELGAAHLALAPCEDVHGASADGPPTMGYDLTLVALGVGATGEPEPEGSLERLARWVRERASRRLFELALRERAWVDGIAKSLGGEGFWDRDENGLRLVVHLTRPPDPEVLSGWVKKVLHELAHRVWQTPPAG